MKRSEMLKNIATELVHEYTNFMQFDKAQELAEIVLNRIEHDGMKPPEALFKANHKGCLCTMHESCPSCGGWCNEWEQEDSKEPS